MSNTPCLAVQSPDTWTSNGRATETEFLATHSEESSGSPTFFPVALSFEYIHISHQRCIHGCHDFPHAQHSSVAHNSGNSWILLAAPRAPADSVKSSDLSAL